MKILKTRVKCCHFNNSTIRRNTSRKISFFRSHLQPGNHLEHPLPERRSLNALLPALELGYAQTRSRCCHQLGLFQSRHHHLLRLVAPQRANHPLVPPRHHPHPFRHVPLQPYVRNEQSPPGAETTKIPIRLISWAISLIFLLHLLICRSHSIVGS